ncbi:MAG: cation-translocating P-type ATPase [Phycisphaeraceae bacterium]|nr:cation-translocating P-type ATPase [Phycisphaeraceae bacterium]MBX3407579.1 cation-translocating P-type ATPase [Phycisphaeraceae bacterium]
MSEKAAEHGPDGESDAPSGRAGRLWAAATSARGEFAAAVAAGFLLLVGAVLGRIEAAAAVGVAMVWLSLAIGMVHGVRAATQALREGKVDIDVLMVVGAALAAWVGAPAEGALLLFLFVLSGALEDLAMQRTKRAVEALHQLLPTRALRLEGDAWREVAPEDLRPGDRVKVLPGEAVPADARVAEGLTSVDQASLTGESMPRTVRPGDEIWAGTINVGDPVQAEVTRVAAESSLQRVLRLVTEAQQQREPVQRMIDRLSQPYALAVFGVSITVFLVWWLVLGAPLVGEGPGGRGGAIYTAITLLIVASPCAVIIATPTATLAAIARAARGGVLFKGGQAIERLSRLGAVAFDKTGTLTIGRPRVRQLHPVGWSDEERLLAVAAGLEQDSTHPIAKAVRDEATRRGIEPAAVSEPGFTPGRGVSATVDGKPARLGSMVHARDLVPECFRNRVQEVLDGVQQRGQIGVVIAHDQQAGVIILADAARPGAAGLVERLHGMGVKPVCMFTGDNTATARAVAESLGIDRWHAEMLPQDKVEGVAALKNEVHADRSRPGSRRAVGVIGDGVNDAPALSAADVAIGIGSIGSDAALESADIVLLNDDLSVVPWALRIARRARATIAFNLWFAVSAIVVMAVALLAGSLAGWHAPLWMGVLGHEGGTLLVVLNSLLILAAKGPGAAVAGLEFEAAPTATRPTESAAAAAAG